MQSIVSPMDVATSNTGGIPAEGHPPLAAHRPPAASMGPPSAPASASVLPATTSRTGVSQSGAGDKKSRGKNFSLDESTQLARSWINVSEDPKVGAYQTGATFWTRVFQHYHQNRLSHWPERTASSLENKFKTMSAEVSKFVAAFKQIEDHVASGWGPEDIFQEAMKLFEEVNKSVFSWKALSVCPKFNTSNTEKDSKRRKRAATTTVKEEVASPATPVVASGAGGIGATADTVFAKESRPIGTKKAKVEGKQTGASADFKEMGYAQGRIAAAMLLKSRMQLFLAPVPDNIDARARRFLEIAKDQMLSEMEAEKAQQRSNPQSFFGARGRGCCHLSSKCGSGSICSSPSGFCCFYVWLGFGFEYLQQQCNHAGSAMLPSSIPPTTEALCCAAASI